MIGERSFISHGSTRGINRDSEVWTMKEYGVVIAAVVTGVFGIILWWRKKKADETNLIRSQEKQKYEEKKKLYVRVYRLFEDAIRLTRERNESRFAVTEDFHKANAEIHLLASDNVSTSYEKACLNLEKWSELYAKASPKTMKLRDQTITMLQSPDPTAKYQEPAKQAFSELQESLDALIALMKNKLRVGS